MKRDKTEDSKLKKIQLPILAYWKGNKMKISVNHNLINLYHLQINTLLSTDVIKNFHQFINIQLLRNLITLGSSNPSHRFNTHQSTLYIKKLQLYNSLYLLCSSSYFKYYSRLLKTSHKLNLYKQDFSSRLKSLEQGP